MLLWLLCVQNVSPKCPRTLVSKADPSEGFNIRRTIVRDQCCVFALTLLDAGVVCLVAHSDGFQVYTGRQVLQVCLEGIANLPLSLPTVLGIVLSFVETAASSTLGSGPAK
jgi:hypothetical protein